MFRRSKTNKYDNTPSVLGQSSCRVPGPLLANQYQEGGPEKYSVKIKLQKKKKIKWSVKSKSFEKSCDTCLGSQVQSTRALIRCCKGL